MVIQHIEWAGCLTGLAGSALLAANIRISKFGWWLFIVSNFLMIAFSLIGGHNGLLVQQIGFTVTSFIGVLRSNNSRVKKIRFCFGEHEKALKQQKLIEGFGDGGYKLHQ